MWRREHKRDFCSIDVLSPEKAGHRFLPFFLPLIPVEAGESNLVEKSVDNVL